MISFLNQIEPRRSEIGLLSAFAFRPAFSNSSWEGSFPVRYFEVFDARIGVGATAPRTTVALFIIPFFSERQAAAEATARALASRRVSF